jgi:hypothetical protein
MARIGNEAKLILKLAEDRAEALRAKAASNGYAGYPLIKGADQYFGFDHGLGIYRRLLQEIVSEIENP